MRYHIDGDKIVIDTGGDSFSVDFDSVRLAQTAEKVLHGLVNERLSISQLSSQFDSYMKPYSVIEFLNVLDAQHILTDSENTVDTISGKTFICDIEHYYHNILLPSFEQDEFSRRVYAKTIDDASLLRWSVEYYHVTCQAERVLAASMVHTGNSQLHSALREFFFDEVGHEKLLRRSLLGAGMTACDIDNCHPHLCTEVVMAMLLRSAHFHLPTFITLVALMEGNNDESRNYISALESSTLSNETIRHQVVHEKINIEGNHGNEAREMFSHINALTLADLTECKRAVVEFIMVRRSLTPYLMGGDYFPDLDRGSFINILQAHLPRLKLKTLPIAIPKASLALCERLVKMLLSIKNTQFKDFDPKIPAELSMIMFENALWKVAYTNLDSYIRTLDWLDAIVDTSDIKFTDMLGVDPVMLHFVNQLPVNLRIDASQLLDSL